MKKILLFASALAGMFFAASCQQENLEPEQAGQQVTFTIEAPAAMQTKAIADGQNVDQLVYEVWLTPTLGNLETGAQKLYQATADMVSDGTTNKAELTLDLVNDQKFTVLFWAQVEGTYDTEELTAVGYKDLDALKANDESLAAFYGVAYVDDCRNVKKDGTSASPEVILKRPFAQLNLCTLNTSTAYTVVMEESEVIVENVPTVFNVVNGVEDVNSYEKVEFDMNVVPSDPATIKVNNQTYQYAGMNYMFAGSNITLEYNIKTRLNGQSEAEVKNIISDVPLKENHRTNIVGNLLTSQTDFKIIVDAAFELPDEIVGEGTVLVKNSDELVAALKRNEPHLVIDLLGAQTKAVNPVEYQVPVGAWTEKYYFGGDQTRTITINANGNKINFVHENTDWNYIRMVNDNAKWIINDATLTNSGENDGPWNRHDIRFYNAVELNNVTSDKAIALLNDSELNNVTITEETGAYGLWITANGQKVDINGLNITATNGGRGIAIKEEYVDAPACVTLNVENAKFETAEKAAILVTSTKGAVITLKDIDITKVAEDSDFAVWVDEDRAADADKVVVKGGLCKVEGATDSVADSSAELLADLKVANQTVYLYPTEDGGDLKLEGKISLAEGVSLIGLGEEPVPVFNDWGSNAFANQAHFTNTYVENINFTNNLVIDAGIANGNVTFKNCVFGGDRAHQGVHFDSGEGTVVFDNCTFVGRNMLGSSLEKVIFNNCTFLNKKASLTGADKWTGVNMWGKYEFNNCVFDTEAHCNVKCDGVEAAFNGCKFVDDRDVTSVILNSPKFNANITFDGTPYHTNIEAAITAGVTNIYLTAGKYAFPQVDLRGKELTLVGSKDVVIDASAIDTRNQFVTDATLKFEGVTLNFGKVNYMGFANTASLTYKNCNINGLQFLTRNDVVFEGCTLNSNGAEHSVWTYGAKNVTFTDCDFTYGDRAVNCYSDNDVDGGKQTVNFTDCTFATSNTASEGAVEINSCFFSVGIEVNMDGCTAPEYGQMAFVSKWDSTNGSKTTINIK